MKNRLRRHEKEAIHERYKDEPLYQLLYAPTKAFERKMKHFALSSDEVFMEVMDVLDYFKANKQEARYHARSLFDTVFTDYRELADTQVSDEEITLATSVMLYGVVMCLNQVTLNTYTSLATIILTQLSDPQNHVNVSHLHDNYYPTYCRLDAQQLQDSFVDYMKSERVISKEIKDMLAELPAPTIEDVTRPTNNPEHIFNRQLVLLFLQLMNVPLDNTTNINAFSKFLAYVSGNSAGSIRVLMQNGVDYDAESTKKDLALLAKKVKPFAPDIADEINFQ